jgi:class 3 adenylate cyclase
MRWPTPRSLSGTMTSTSTSVERAHASHVERGAVELAAADAVRLAVLFVPRGELGLAAGWLGTAARLLEDRPGGAGVGTALVAFLQGAFAAAVGDLAAAEELAERTMGLGRQLRDLEVQTLGMVVRAEVMARRGRAAVAGPLLDQAMATALGPTLTPWASCFVLCRTMISCQVGGDLVRAQQWVEAAREAHRRGGPNPLAGDCRIHHAGLLNWRGDWTEAEQEAAIGCTELPRDLMHQGMAAYEVGEIRLARGDLRGAEDALVRAHELGRSPQPGMALAHLAEGHGRAALAMLVAALEDERAPVLRAPLLEAQVEVALAEGQADIAHAAGAELADLDRTLTAPLVTALAASAKGGLALADGDPAACPALRDGVRRWTAMGAPYRAARNRVLLAEAYVGRGDPDSAALELRAARTAFERLGAQPDAHRTARALREVTGETAPAAGNRVRRTFMFTDIVASTPLVEALGDDAWSDLLRWHDSTLRAQFAAYAGQEVDHAGDGFFVAFENAAAAVRCAMSIQSGLASHRRAAGFAPQVRIGIHADDASSSDDGYRGRGVHVAARLSAEASGGEILASAGTLEEAGLEVETGQPRTALLKGVSEPMTLLPVIWM